MANFKGRSGSLLLFTSEERGVVVDSELNLIVASGSSEILASSQYWEDGEYTEASFSIASEALSSNEITITASAKRMYTIPKGVQNEAKKSLEWRKEHHRGGTNVGMNTARTLARGGQIGIEKVRHIAKYFARHEVDKQGKGWEPGEDGFPSNGRIAWALWGGDAAWRWASAIVERENKKTITADAYGYSHLTDHSYPDMHAFEKAHELDEEYGPEFLTRVRLDGSGMDRLYKIDHDGEVYIWDDGSWDNFGRIGNNIWDYDRELDDENDMCEKSHVVVDPESAIVIASQLHANPFENVHIEDIDNHEARLAADAIDGIDWEFIGRTITAAGTEADGVYSEEERSKNATQQVRDKTGKFAKMGGRVMVGGDPTNGMGKITATNREKGTVTVQLDNGNTVEVAGKGVEAIGGNVPTAPQIIEEPLDVSGILGEPRTPVDRAQAQLPGTLPAMTQNDLHALLSDWPSWVQSQREQFSPMSQPNQVAVQGKNSTSTGGYGDQLEAKTGKHLLTNAYEHPLLSDWLNRQDGKGYTPNKLWYNPLTAAGAKNEPEKELTPETSDVQPIYMAVVDKDDPRAVLALICLVPASSTKTQPMVYSRKVGKWERDPQTLADLNSATPPPVVPLDETVLNDVLKQVDISQGADKTKDKEEGAVTAALALTVLFGPTITAAGGLDRNRGNAETLRRYWTKGAGAAKIRWGKGGDWKRCVRLLAKHLGPRAKGYCQLRHKEALGYYTSTHAKMIRKAKGGASIVEEFSGVPEEPMYGFPENVVEYEIPQSDLEAPLDQILAEEDSEMDYGWEPESEIVQMLAELRACSDAEYALVAAGGLDRNRGQAEKLRRYWTTGKGGAKIRWGTDGDWTRCVRNLSKYLGPRAKGYCALRHKEMNGIWPGDKRNRQFAIHASGGVLYSDFFIRSEEEIISEAALTARKKLTAARFAVIASGMKKPVDEFFSKDSVERTPEMENIVATEAPVDEQDIKIVDLIPSQETVDMDNVEEVMDSEKPVDVVITEDGPVLVDGHHRTVAHEARGEETVPAKIYNPMTASGEATGARFSIPLIIPEEVESGDGRKFKRGAITMRDLPLPLMWQFKTSDGHSGSVVVGRIDQMERTAQGIGNAYGVFDTSEYAAEAERMVRNGFLRGISADMDKFEAEEKKKPKEDEELDGANEKLKKDKILINKARIMGVTIVPKPAFQECTISVVDGTPEDSQEEPMIEDGIYVDDVDPREAATVLASAMIAGAIPTEPPADWFKNPKLSQPTPLTIDNEGRVFGHIAAWNVDHIGMVAGTKPPRSQSNYQYFHTGVCRTAEGSDIPVGQLTLAGGHADITASAAVAAKHYDDTASAIADVHAGEDSHGIWVAGALRPGTSPEQVRALRASAPSGDWRPIRGRLELVAVCQVNVPGFPIARARVASGQVVALVAAGAYALAQLRVDPMEELAQRLAKIEETQNAPLIAAAKAAKAKLAVIRAGGIGMEQSEPILVEALENLLADVVTIYFRTHAYHWNVKGQDFAQYHELFEEIYQDIYSSIDPIAENIRKLGHDAPISLTELVGDSSVPESEVDTADPKTLAYDLYRMNELLVVQLKAVFDLTNAINEQGVANFIAERIDSHMKWSWQLRSSIIPEEMAFMENEGASEEMEDMHYINVFSALEEMGLVASLYKERKFTTKQRENLAKKGFALPDGSYPIENVEDLKNAIQAYGRAPLKKREAVKKHIVKRARALKKQDLIPTTWGVPTNTPEANKLKKKTTFSVVEPTELRARIESITAALKNKEE
jgi:DNA-binding ferritin-like protein